jgi:prepilin-type N-terminal cleavage/methylation domain-containing protein
MTRPTKQGFTLIELAIVLVIIGLLVGGVMVGSTLIYQAGLTSVVRNIGQSKIALNAFRDKYGKWPGDFPDATKFWGVGTSCPSNAGSGTCDGNGDQVITLTSASGSESTYLWQHLGLAGLIAGKYNPNWPDGATLSEAYVPHMRLNDWGEYIKTWDATNTDWFDSTNERLLNHLVIFIGDVHPGSGTHTQLMAQTFPCADAKAIDDKLDDLLPGTGLMHAERFGGCASVTTANAGSTAHYLNPEQYSPGVPNPVTTVTYIIE